MTSPPEPQVLAGLRVLDFGSFITAPYAAMLLAEMGADVVKIELPGSGDPFRAFNDGLYSSHFQAHNRNKRSLALDYRKPETRGVLERLLASADVALLNVRPGVEEHLGLSYGQIAQHNSRLIYCSITGFGSSGPYAKQPAYDNVGQTVSGWLSMFHHGTDARVAGPAISDAITGIFGALGILAALHERSRTGTGRKVEVSMLESMIAFATEPLARLFSSGQALDFFARAAASQSFIVTCADGLRIGLHLSSPPKFWDALLAAVGAPELASRYPSRADRVREYDELAADLARIFATQPRAYWLPLLAKHDVPFAAENQLQDLAKDPQVRHLNILHTTLHPTQGEVRAPHRPVRFDGSNHSNFLPPPMLGEHSFEILQELGVNPTEVEQLLSAGLLGIPPSE
ncbi:MAG: CoA transferase [Acidobacteriota bacterium]|nr:CoA transferase [Acidobacteriota bacterium]